VQDRACRCLPGLNARSRPDAAMLSCLAHIC
jgi:hypothetical protein